jgi:putative membrane protein
MMLAFVGAIVAAVVVLVRPAEGRAETPERILADRFARGEIDEDQYQRRRHALRG